MTKITEQPSLHRNLEQKSIAELTRLINQEDQSVPLAIEKELPRIQTLIGAIVEKLRQGGRLFYVGAGSGGRLSVLDVIELPTTYGVDKGVFNVVLAGGIARLADALEEMEDDEQAGWDALQQQQVGPADIVVGISASGTTPFVLGALQRCQQGGIATGCLVSNPGSVIAAAADYPVEVITGPEFITGSTRMKCGTAQKMLFDMISTTVMIQLGRVQDNKMVHVKLINNKIIDRSVRMLMELSGLSDYEQAREELFRHGSVKSALSYLNSVNS
ncbi:MAG: N-acetylmuramic acid 6-phosphate etherase [Adhaeribacter sp.]